MTHNNNNNRRQAWQWLQQQNRFTHAELVAASNLTKSGANGFIKFLLEYKRIKCVRPRKGRKGAIYQVINTDYIRFGSGSRKGCRNTTGKKGSAKQRCWNSMRILQTFAISEIAAAAEVAISTAGNYIRALTQAGFVRCIQGVDKASDPHSLARFRLIHNSGPLYPIVCNDGVYDQNTEQRHAYVELTTHPVQPTNKEPEHGQKLA